MTRTNGLVYAVVAVAALALNGVMAAQYGPYEMAGMGPDPAYVYSDAVEQWRPSVDAVCAEMGCATDYVLGVIDCESGGDPGAIGPNGELGILQVDPAFWGEMDSVSQIRFFASPPDGAWWVCA